MYLKFLLSSFSCFFGRVIKVCSKSYHPYYPLVLRSIATSTIQRKKYIKNLLLLTAFLMPLTIWTDISSRGNTWGIIIPTAHPSLLHSWVSTQSPWHQGLRSERQCSQSREQQELIHEHKEQEQSAMLEGQELVDR